MQQITKVLQINPDIVSVSEARAYLRVTEPSEDNFISVCIDSAVAYIENRLGYDVCSRSMQTELAGYVAGEPAEIGSPGQNISIDSVEADGSPEAVDYTYINGIFRAAASGNIIIKYTVTADIAKDLHIKQAALLLIGKFFEQRGDDSRALTEGGWETVDRLLSLVSVIWI